MIINQSKILMEGTRKIILIDKDDTLGQFNPSGSGVFPGVEKFLKRRQDKTASLYVASTAPQELCRSDLRELSAVFQGIFGVKEIGREVYDYLYLDQEGVPRFVDEDFVKRIERMLPERRAYLGQRMNELDESLLKLEQKRLSRSPEHIEKTRTFSRLKSFADRLIHKETGSPLDENARYKNPYLERQHPKDLHLARRWIAGSAFANLHMVMIGDTADLGVGFSDPETPLIIISDSVREGNWTTVERLVDVLMHSQMEAPHQVYDALFEDAVAAHGNWKREIEGVTYTFQREEQEGVLCRRIYCP